MNSCHKYRPLSVPLSLATYPTRTWEKAKTLLNIGSQDLETKLWNTQKIPDPVVT